MFSDPYLNQIQISLNQYMNSMSPEDVNRMQQIVNKVHGYGTVKQFSFFNAVMAKFRIRKVLLVGVYMGRDASFILNAANHLNIDLNFTGVDKFSDDFCEDWPEEMKGKSWSEAGFGTCPNIEATLENLSSVGFDNVNLIKQRDEDYLSRCQEVYDLIYLDTSHDYETVLRQLNQVENLIHPNTIIAGDDYSDRDTWGVIKAVKENTTEHGVHMDWVWYTSAANLSPNKRKMRRHFPDLVE